MFNKFLQTFFTLGITVFCNIAQLDFCKFTNFADSEKKEKWKKLEIVNQILFLYSLNQYTFRCLEPLSLSVIFNPMTFSNSLDFFNPSNFNPLNLF